MKRCPKCRRDYYDESLLYCLDDGVRLLDQPARTAAYLCPNFPPETSLDLLIRPKQQSPTLPISR